MSDTNPCPGIPCVNCGKTCVPSDLQLFEGVGVCSECHEVASLVVARGRKELQVIMSLLTELVRVALVEGNLHLPRGGEPPSKAEVLRMIITLKEAQARRKVRQDDGQIRAGLY